MGSVVKKAVGTVGGLLGGAAGGIAEEAVGEGYQGRGRTIDPEAFKVKGAAAAQKIAESQSGEQRRSAARTKRQQDVLRDQRQDQLSQLFQQAQGKGPSLAQAQLKAASDRSLAQQLAAAGRARGTNSAAVGRQLARQQAAAGQQLAQDAATARIQEQQLAQQNLQAALTSGAAQEQQRRQLETQAGQAALQQMLQSGMAQQQARQAFEQLATNQQLGIVKSRQEGAAAKQAAQGQIFGGLAQAGGQVGAAFASDKNKKKDIKKADMKKDFLDKLSAKSYKYKDSKDGKGEQLGIMAQDLEKTKVGKQMVEDTPNGKMVNMAKGFGAVLAAQAELNKRLEQLEKKKNKKA